MQTIESAHKLLGGTDGYRDLSTEEPGSGQMNPETIAGMTYALVTYQFERGFEGPVAVAQDTRRSGEILRQAAIAGALAAGAEVIDYGILSTPGAQRAAQTIEASATIVMSASHNPAEYNGWKGMLGILKPQGATVKDLSDRYWDQVDSGLVIPHELNGQKVEFDDTASEAYISDIVNNIQSEFGESPLKEKLFVVDGANGAGMKITPEVFRRLGAEVREFACDKDGEINDNCGAAKLSGVKKFLLDNPKITQDTRFVGAVANDGDADRVMGVAMVDGVPEEITGNHIMEAMALYPKQPGIVGTIYTNSGMRYRLEANGVDFEECGNGDVHVTNALRKRQETGQNWNIGGEFTGHLIDMDWLSSGDGARSAAWFAAYAAASNKKFADIYREQPMWPERMEQVKLPDNRRINVEESQFIQTALGKVIDLGARPIVRASGTEPLIRAWTEAPEESIATLSSRLLIESVYATLDAE